MQVVILTTNTDIARQVRYLGPYQIAWWLRKNGYSTQVLEFLYFMSPEQRLALYKKFITVETKIVAYAPFCMLNSPQQFAKGREPIFDIAHEIKENFPWVKLVAGGQWVRGLLDNGYKNFNFKFDAIFKDEGEYSFLEYVDHIFNGAPAPVFQLGKDNNKVYLPTKTYDIQSCAMTYSDNDFVLPGESLPLELSRGCIFKCKFCQYPHIGKDKDDFNKSMNCIRESLISNYNLFGTTRYHITDDTLNSHRERTKQFHLMTKTLPFKIEFIGYVRMDLLSIWPEQVESLPESGLISAHFGIETFNSESCHMIGKGWGAKNNKKYLTYIGDQWGDDVIVNVSMIAGLGNETETDWLEAKHWFMDSKVHDWYFNKLYISGNLGLSEFDRNPEKYGYRFIDGKWETNYVTEDQANSWCNKNNLDTMSMRTPSVWNLVANRNLGIDLETLRNNNYIGIREMRKSLNLINKIINQYYTMAMSY
jgi:hypothetical protein